MGHELSNKYLKYYMKLTKEAALNSECCLSRKVACLIVNPLTNSIVATGINGVPRGTPNAGSLSFLNHVWESRLSDEDRGRCKDKQEFIDKVRGKCDTKKCWRCPRQVLNYKSGERLDICGCVHAEVNALANAAKTNSNTLGCYVFIWEPTCCSNCAAALINAQISTVVWIRPLKDYSVDSRWLFGKAGINIIEIDKQDIE